MPMICLVSCFILSKYVLHALAGNRTIEAREEPRMYKLYACCNIHNVIARELSKLHSSALHVHTARHEDRMYAMDFALLGNS